MHLILRTCLIHSSHTTTSSAHTRLQRCRANYREPRFVISNISPSSSGDSSNLSPLTCPGGSTIISYTTIIHHRAEDRPFSDHTSFCRPWAKASLVRSNWVSTLKLATRYGTISSSQCIYLHLYVIFLNVSQTIYARRLLSN